MDGLYRLNMHKCLNIIITSDHGKQFAIQYSIQNQIISSQIHTTKDDKTIVPGLYFINPQCVF